MTYPVCGQDLHVLFGQFVQEKGGWGGGVERGVRVRVANRHVDRIALWTKICAGRVIRNGIKELFERHEYLSWHLIFAPLNIAVTFENLCFWPWFPIKCKFKCKFIDIYIFLYKSNNKVVWLIINEGGSEILLKIYYIATFLCYIIRRK